MSLPRDSKVFIAGHHGMVGRALWSALENNGFTHLIGRTRTELDLRNAAKTGAFLEEEKPDVILIAAAKVGGIEANRTQPADFLFDNLQIQTNLIHGAQQIGTHKLLFLGSPCIFPRLAEQPMSEDSLFTGPVEPTNEGYAMAKLAGLKMCQTYRQQHNCDFITVIPTNLYGRYDHYDPNRSHVIPALIAKYHQAKVNGDSNLTNWGTGSPQREFLNVNDAAEACVFLLDNYSDAKPINIAGGREISICELNDKIATLTGYKGAVEWDTEKPDGMPRKLLDGTRLTAMGWTPKINFDDGLQQAYKDYLERVA
ncbi:MAG: GDP-L-fucose synthase [Verrucomicrobiota bacterium]|nr:GDP-L-fucose synthase [Verrucomicrobiota bacterium]